MNKDTPKYSGEIITIHKIANTNQRYEASVGAATRILWINGDVDPWHKQSNYEVPPGREQPVLRMVRGARHCAWMSRPGTTDQLSVREARREIWEQLDQWLAPTPPPSADPTDAKRHRGKVLIVAAVIVLFLACCLGQKKMTPVRAILCPCCTCGCCRKPLEQPHSKALYDSLNAGPTDSSHYDQRASW